MKNSFITYNKDKTVKVNIKKIIEKDTRFLYELLSERNEKENISHKLMPTYHQHKKFILSKPYSFWYMIKIGNNYVGTIYLSKQNEIGIHLKKKFQKQGIGRIALHKMMEKHPKKRFLANINPKNKKSIKFFQKNGFKLIQYTYELRTDKKNEKTS